MNQNRHQLPECVVSPLWSESLNGKCAELHTVAASNNRDHKITFVVTISKYYQLFTSFTSIITGHSPKSFHWEHSIIACSRHMHGYYSLRTSRSWWIAQSTQCQLRGCNTTLGPVMLINRKFDISCKLDISRNISTCGGGVMVGLAPKKQSSTIPQLKYEAL